MDHYYALILAGGGGTRLWPASRKTKPKQMLPLVGDGSMFRTSIERLYPLFEPNQIYISTGQIYVDDLQADAPEIPPENFIIEPSARNNAAAVGLAITVIQKRDPEAVIAMLTADHHIGKTDLFRDVLATAYTIAQQDHIVTLGIAPTFPSTGFGYIQRGKEIDTINEFTYCEATRFTEKPDVVRATQFIASGKYSWNSGMFIWKAQKALQEFKLQQPDVHQLFMALQPAVDTPEFKERLEEIWEKMPVLSIDIAIMEQAQGMTVIPIDIGWSDVGSWASLYDVLQQDSYGNCGKTTSAERIILDAKNSLVYTDKLAVAIGVEDVVVVETDDVLMICHKSRAQDVKEIVQYLRDNDMGDYL